MSKTLKLHKIDVTAPTEAGAGKITFENRADRKAFVEGEAQHIRDQVLSLDNEEAVLDAKKLITALTREELLAALAALPPDPSKMDPTMDLPTGEIPAHLIADKSTLPPVSERTGAPVQAPANVHGSFGLRGIPLLAPGVLPANIDVATGRPFVQVGHRPATQISPPPSRRFDGR